MKLNPNEIIAIEMFLDGIPYGVSTGICGKTTYGFGILDSNGYWQYPLPQKISDLLALYYKALSIQKEIRETKDLIEQYLEIK